jgi:hypothetical protein
MKNLTLIFLLFTHGLIFGRDNLKTGTNKMPVYFVENQGQIHDQYGKPRQDVNYVLSTPGMTLFIGQGQLHYQYMKKTAARTEQSPPSAARRYEIARTPYELFRLDMELVGHNEQAMVSTAGPQKERYNYYTASGTEITGVKSFEKIIYHDIYPFVDWVIYVNNEGLKYDFVIHPGGRIADIKMKYTGASSLQLEKNGNMSVNFLQGKLTEEAPYSYQEADRKMIASKFLVSGNTVSFKTGDFKGALVIDPGVSWSTYYGGSGVETSMNVSCDKDGFVYITGLTESVSGIATTGAHQSTYGGGIYDNYLAKFDSMGVLQWATYYGGGGSSDALSGLDLYSSVACDRFGHVYLAGMTLSEDNIATPGSYQSAISPLPSNLDHSNGYLVQFNSSGIRNWGTYYGVSAHYTAFFDVACDEAGNVYVVGQSDSTTSTTNQLTSLGAHQAQCGGEADGLLVKFNMSGNRLWATYYGGQGYDIGYSVACDSAGNVYIGGSTSTSSTNGIATAGAFQSSISPLLPIEIGFVARFNPSGTRSWGTYINGTVGSLALDTFNHLYVAGKTQNWSGISNIATPGTWMYTPAYNTPAHLGFLMQFNAVTCAREWGTFYGGEKNTYDASVACDNKGNVYYEAYTDSYDPLGVDAIATRNSYQDTLCAPPGLATPNKDILLAQFDFQGKRKWASYFGGADNEYSAKVACSPSGAIYTLLTTSSSTHIATTGSQQTILSGTSDAALVRWLPVDIAIGALIKPDNDTICAELTPILVSVKNKGQLDKTDTLFTSVHYTGPVSGNLDAFFNNNIFVGETDTLLLGTPTFSTPGTYDFVAYLHYTRNDDNRENDTLYFTLEVTNVLPDAAIAFSQVGTAFNFSKVNPVPGETYLWNFGDGNTSTEAAPQHQYAQTDSFVVTLFVTNYCGTDTATVKIKGIGNGSGIGDPALSKSITLYPNPASFSLRLTVPSNIRIQNYEIMDLSGRTVQKDTYASSAISISGLAEGNYILKLFTNEGSAYLRFIKSGL